MLQSCSQATSGFNTMCLNQSHMFKMCLKRLFKKLCKLQKLQNSNSSEVQSVLFFPELISDISVADFEKKIQNFK